MKRLALLLGLMVAGLLSGQTITMPDKLSAPVGRLTRIAVATDGDDLRLITSGNVDAIREYDPDPKKVRVAILPFGDGIGHVHAIAIKGAKLGEFATCEINQGVAPPPPPDPADPLAADVKAAFDADEPPDRDTRSAAAKAWIAWYRIAAGIARNSAVSTRQEFYTAMASAEASSAPPKVSLVRTRAVFAADMRRRFPLPPGTTPLTTADRAAIATQYERYARLLENQTK